MTHDLTDSNGDSALLGERALSKLKWRCRRGLVENDIFIARFFATHEQGLTVRQAQGLGDLMDLSDNDLLDLLLQRKQPQELSDNGASSAEALEVLKLLRGPCAVRPAVP
jgi:antitoxin CptB